MYFIWQRKEDIGDNLTHYFAARKPSYDDGGLAHYLAEHFDVTHAGASPEVADDSTEEEVSEFLEFLFHKYNCERPEDFFSYSLSVGDIVCIRCKRENKFYRVDSSGFSLMRK